MGNDIFNRSCFQFTDAKPWLSSTAIEYVGNATYAGQDGGASPSQQICTSCHLAVHTLLCITSLVSLVRLPALSGVIRGPTPLRPGPSPGPAPSPGSTAVSASRGGFLHEHIHVLTRANSNERMTAWEALCVCSQQLGVKCTSMGFQGFLGETSAFASSPRSRREVRREADALACAIFSRLSSP